MRIPVSLLILCAAITGCTTDADPTLTQEISITSIPPNAAVRLNGTAVGRTPTTITVERNSNYDLAVGKGGYTPETAYLKPSLRTNPNGVMDYGFPEKINVTLAKIPGADEVAVPEGDEAEFKNLIQKTNEGGLASRSGDSAVDMKKDVEAVKQDIEKIKAALTARESAYSKKIDELAKLLAETKSAEFKSNDAAAESRVLEAEAALKAALDSRNSVASTEAKDTLTALQSKLSSLEARIDAKTAEDFVAKLEQNKAAIVKALSESDVLVAKALANLDKAKADRAAAMSGKDVDARVATVEAAIAAQQESNKQFAQQNGDLLKVLSERNERLIAMNGGADVLTKAEAAKQLEDIQKALEEQKSAAAAAVAEMNAKIAEANAAVMTANAESKKRIYAEFNTRYALLENRHRNKEITAAEFKAKIAELRQELGQ